MVSLVFVLSLLVIASIAEATVPCPFDPSEPPSCICSGSDHNTKKFESAKCLPSLPIIPPFSGSQYKITDRLTIGYNVYQIKALAFAAFDSIDTLVLEQSSSSIPVQAQWDYVAFADVNIAGIDITGVAGLIPPNTALIKSGGNGLQRLRIADCRESVYLEGKKWSKFQNLSRLEIHNTPIVDIEDEAFAGLENTLESLSMTSTSISTFPTNALKKLNKLRQLKLDTNPIEHLVNVSFQGLTSLQNLSIGNAHLTSLDLSIFNGLDSLRNLVFNFNSKLETLEVSKLDHVPQNISSVWLRNTNLATVSPNVESLLNRTKFELLNLGNNPNMICNESMRWMAKHALCGTPKLHIHFSACANQNQSVEDYLRETVTNPCGEISTIAPIVTTTAVGSTTVLSTTSILSTSSQTPPGTTPKSASALTASVFLTTSMLAVFTAAVRF